MQKIIQSILLLFTCATSHRVKLKVQSSIPFSVTSDQMMSFTGDVPLVRRDGIDSKLRQFVPSNACLPMPKEEVAKMGAERYIFIVDRGECSFETKFINVQQIPNASAILMINSVSKLPKFAEIDALRIEIPGVMIEKEAGNALKDLVVNDPNASASLNVIRQNTTFMTIMQFTLILIVMLLAMSFITSVFMHFKMYREQMRNAENTEEEEEDEGLLKKESLSKLSVIHFSASIKNINESCPICIEEYTKDEKVRLLPCGHVYHLECIDPWLTEKSSLCPLCKQDVVAALEKKSYAIWNLIPSINLFQRDSTQSLGPVDIEMGPTDRGLRRTRSEHLLPAFSVDSFHTANESIGATSQTALTRSEQ